MHNGTQCAHATLYGVHIEIFTAHGSGLHSGHSSLLSFICLSTKKKVGLFQVQASKQFNVIKDAVKVF